MHPLHPEQRWGIGAASVLNRCLEKRRRHDHPETPNTFGDTLSLQKPEHLVKITAMLQHYCEAGTRTEYPLTCVNSERIATYLHRLIEGSPRHLQYTGTYTKRDDSRMAIALVGLCIQKAQSRYC